jgi:hypothetical protein
MTGNEHHDALARSLIGLDEQVARRTAQAGGRSVRVVRANEGGAVIGCELNRKRITIEVERGKVVAAYPD